MHLHYNNVNDAFQGLVAGFLDGSFDSNPKDHHDGADYSPPMSSTPTRNGLAIRIDEPVTITYRYPRQRVLFNAARNANPFFHMVEALWMLAGRNDIAPLLYFNKEVASFSDDGKTWHGAYGHRWRHHYGFDQIDAAIKILQREPTTRRVVIDHWDAGSDLSQVLAKPQCKDVPCNTTIMLQLRSHDTKRTGTTSYGERVTVIGSHPILDMTVTNRSNDLIWGALGSNYVHFTMLQEYIACALGVDVGLYHQISNNLHCYYSEDKIEHQSNLLTREWLSEKPNWYFQNNDCAALTPAGYFPQRILAEPEDRAGFDKCLTQLFSSPPENSWAFNYTDRFLNTTVQPMLLAWHHHKKRLYNEAAGFCEMIADNDWRVACSEWIKRTEARYRRATNDGPY